MRRVSQAWHKKIPTLCLSVSDGSASSQLLWEKACHILGNCQSVPPSYSIIVSSHAVCYFWLCHHWGDRKKHYPSEAPSLWAVPMAVQTQLPEEALHQPPPLKAVIPRWWIYKGISELYKQIMVPPKHVLTGQTMRLNSACASACTET